MAGSPPRPDYKVYRSRPRPFDRLRGLGGLEGLRRRRGGPKLPGAARERPPLRRVARWVAIAVGVWIALALVLFFLSAQFEQGEGLSRDAERNLEGGSSFLFGSTVLVIGSDQRPSTSTEEEFPPRADSIILLRASLGEVRRVSILRDSLAQIPGQSPQKINAAYAIGGTDLLIDTVERYLGGGVEVNHVIRLSFDDFPKLIDALGGISLTLDGCVRSQKFNGRRVNLKRGTHHLDGQQALRFARVRQNLCDPNEDDRARAARQQQVLSAIRSRFISPGAFLRAPWIGWRVPQTINTDLAGPGLSALAFDVATGGAGDTKVLEPAGFGPGGSVLVSEEERAEAADYLTGGG